MEEVNCLPALKNLPGKTRATSSKAMCSEVATGEVKPLDLLQQSSGNLLSVADETSLTFLYDLYKLTGAAGSSSVLSFPRLVLQC